MSTTRRLLPLLALSLLAGGSACAPEYAYVPTTNATASVRGKLAANYAIPPAAPEGNVRIASYGIVDVSPEDNPREVLRGLHLRVVLADNGPSPWTFDTREQRLDLNGRGPLPPAFGSANKGTPPPVVRVDQGQMRVVDLFFLLPPDLQHADAIPEFDALWRVHTGPVQVARGHSSPPSESGPGVVVERTPFERLAIEPDYGAYDDWDYGDGYYWGGPYWMDADWFEGAPYGYFARGIVVRRAPRIWRGGHSGVAFHGGSHEGGGHGGSRR